LEEEEEKMGTRESSFMKIKLKKKPRQFLVGKNKDIKILDIGFLNLNDNEQITLKNKKFVNEVTKKDWGYYLTNSINGRLINNGFKSFLVSNKKKKIFFLVVQKNKEKEFMKYLKKENLKILIDFKRKILTMKCLNFKYK